VLPEAINGTMWLLQVVLRTGLAIQKKCYASFRRY
jgi:hypothetical protein